MKIQSINGQFSALGINSVKNTKFNTPYVYAPITDSVSFKSRDKQLLSASEGEAAANKLRTSTSGYRGKFGERFNDKFVYSLTSAVIQDMNDRNQQISIVAGDTREATKKYAPEIRDMFTKNGIDVLVPQLTPNFTNQISPVASPVLALATKNFNIPLSILLTASHNPWDDGGYNFLTDEGAVADDTTTRPIVENLVSDVVEKFPFLLYLYFCGLSSVYGDLIQFGAKEMKKILLGMSGGVDSTYAISVLREKGYSVEGAVLVMHSYTETDAARDAAASLQVPLHIVDAQGAFDDIVVRDFCDAYRKGETPNPCILNTTRFERKGRGI